MSPLNEVELIELQSQVKVVGNRRIIDAVRRLIDEVNELRSRQAQAMHMYDIEESF